MSKPSFKQPKEPGQLSDGARFYTIPHRSKYFTPWQIEAEPPTSGSIERQMYEAPLPLEPLRKADPDVD